MEKKEAIIILILTVVTLLWASPAALQIWHPDVILTSVSSFRLVVAEARILFYITLPAGDGTSSAYTCSFGGGSLSPHEGDTRARAGRLPTALPVWRSRSGTPGF